MRKAWIKRLRKKNVTFGEERSIPNPIEIKRSTSIIPSKCVVPSFVLACKENQNV